MKNYNIIKLVESCTTEESINKRLKIITKVFREYNKQIMEITKNEIGCSFLEESWIEDFRLI